MKRADEKGGFLTRKTPLPQLSAHDMRAFFAGLMQEQEFDTEVVLNIPLPDDILSVEGKKRWDSQRASCIEQTEIQTIGNDILVRPSQMIIKLPKENVFEALDKKVEESEKIANRIQQDFIDLEIPPPHEPVDVEPLFSATRTKYIRPESTEGTIKPVQDFSIFEKKDKSKKKISSTEQKRILKTIHSAEERLNSASSYRKAHKEKKTNKTVPTNTRPSKTQKIQWDKVSQYVQEETF